MDDLLPYLKQLFVGLTGYEDLSGDSNSSNVPGWDSLVTVNLALALSGRYNIEIGEDDLHSLTSVIGIRELLALKIAK